MHLNYVCGLNVVGKPTKTALSLACIKLPSDFSTFYANVHCFSVSFVLENLFPPSKNCRNSFNVKRISPLFEQFCL